MNFMPAKKDHTTQILSGTMPVKFIDTFFIFICVFTNNYLFERSPLNDVAEIYVSF